MTTLSQMALDLAHERDALLVELMEAKTELRDWRDVRYRDLAAETEQLRAKVARVREMHQEVQFHWPPAPKVCDECESPWPCPTVAALDADLLRKGAIDV